VGRTGEVKAIAPWMAALYQVVFPTIIPLPPDYAGSLEESIADEYESLSFENYATFLANVIIRSLPFV